MSKEFPLDSHGKIIVFGAKQIRRLWPEEQWYFSIADIVAALTNSDAPSKYWTAMKRREENASGFQLSTICRQLKLTSTDGKSYKTEAVNTEAASGFTENQDSLITLKFGYRTRRLISKLDRPWLCQ